MFDGSFFQLASQDAAFVAVCIVGASLLFLTGMVAVIATFLHVRSDWRKRRDDNVEDQWRPVIRAALAGRVDPAVAAAHVDPHERGHYLRLLLLTARELHDCESTVLKEMAAPFLDEARGGHRKEAPEARARRIQLLGWLGDESDFPRLIDALGDPSPLVAIVALRALIRHREVRALRAIVAHLDRFRFWNTRTIASLLAEIGPPIAPALRARATDPENDLRLRLIGLTTLQEIGGEIARQTAVDLLEEVDDRSLITGSLRILEAWGDERHLPLVRRMTRSNDEIVRLRAYSALSAIGSKPETTELETALRDRSAWVAMRAAQALREAGRTDVLVRTANSNSDRAELARQVLSEPRRHP